MKAKKDKEWEKVSEIKMRKKEFNLNTLIRESSAGQMRIKVGLRFLHRQVQVQQQQQQDCCILH